ncbi:GNAT family N-acetyltransferase [Sphingomonas sp. ERG5]|uniref:GNAT family N-acetyltransferase n=1 Tax=Sphingomonas sp. ERG5 TaxID=1381597 RepID=UPI001F26C10E|nr:GNAT family N-acetyltransferase [Sphingomonas sp. ERG5]
MFSDSPAGFDYPVSHETRHPIYGSNANALLEDAALTDLAERNDVGKSTLAPADGSGDWSDDLTTRSGYRFHVRPAVPADEAGLAEFFTHVTADDLRFRFLTAIRKVSHEQLANLVNVDHRRTENFLAIDPEAGCIIATAMMAADKALASAEVAIAIRSDFKDRGISWMLLEHVAKFAGASGIKTLESIESRDNHQAIELEREMGFKAHSSAGDPTVVVVSATLSPPIA